MITQSVGEFAISLSMSRGSNEPRFLVLGKRSGRREFRPTTCSGRVEIDSRVRVVVEKGVLSAEIERVILKRVMCGLIEGPEAALQRWRRRLHELGGGER